MAKRKLTRKQEWQINKIQDERTDRMQRRRAKQEVLLNSGDLGTEQEGLVVAHHGSQLNVEDTQGQVYNCGLRANLDNLVTGDRVVWCAGKDNTGVIVARLPRDTEINRPDFRGKLKPVAANIDQIIIVFSPFPDPSSLLLDRYLVAVELSDIKPILLLNKSDLLKESNTHITEMLQSYEKLGYTTLSSSTKKQEGLSELQLMLDNRVSVFVGQSGVGKSSLVNSLLPHADLQVGAVSEKSGLGTHTTTTSKLFHIPSGGKLIDSPGIREFGLWHLDPESLINGFCEFTPFLGQCKFRNCAHGKEPDCAILQAVNDGQITMDRFNNYNTILKTLA